ncbi:MAG: DEAD/DEAH box helicase [Nanoarchaeota archaeon]
MTIHLLPELQRSINERKFASWTVIQEKTIPLIQEGKDVIGQSHTGSGKTAAFGLPLLEKIVPGQGLQALVLVPTRELCEQVTMELQDFAKYTPLRIIAVYGGVGLEPQKKNLVHADVVVATPGRTLDHMHRKNMPLNKVRIAVLDEADKMMEMGFIDDVRKILSYLPKNRQTLLFSATIPEEVRKLVQQFMQNPIFVKTTAHVEQEKLSQYYYMVDSQEKFSLLVHLLQYERPGIAIIFCATRRRVDALAKNLSKQGFEVHALHGGLSQSQRRHSLGKIREQKAEILVASDVASRGLDIQGVTHVINYDSPRTAKDYVHRIGRTARAGKEGKVITLVASEDYNDFANVRQDKSLEMNAVQLPKDMRKVFFERLSRNEMHSSKFPRDIRKDRWRRDRFQGRKRPVR